MSYQNEAIEEFEQNLNMESRASQNSIKQLNYSKEKDMIPPKQYPKRDFNFSALTSSNNKNGKAETTRESNEKSIVCEEC